MRAPIGIMVFCIALLAMPARVPIEIDLVGPVDCRTVPARLCDRTPGCFLRGEIHWRNPEQFDPRKEGCFPRKKSADRRVRVLCIEGAKLRACGLTVGLAADDFSDDDF
jgi:hypothetical protein